MLNEFTFLRLSGIISSKNHIVVGLLYPRLQHLYSAKTQLSAGVAFGSLSKYIVGVSHAYSKSLAFAAQTQYCAHENKLYTNVCVKQELTSSVSVSASLLLNAAKESRKFFETKSSVVSVSATQNMKNVEEEEDEAPGTVHKGIFGDVVEKRRIGLSLGTSEAKAAVQQKTTFNCLNLSTILSLGATFKADKAHLDGTSLIKWRIPGISGVCAYFGLRFSMDGTHLIVGLKVGTTKLFFPIVVLNTTHAQNRREKNGESEHEWLELLIAYACSSAALGWYNSRKQRQQLAAWRQETLPDLLLKHEQALDLIRAEARKRQRTFRQRKDFIVLRAYYGLKIDIMNHIDLHLADSEQDLYWPDEKQDEINQDSEIQDLMLINITLPVRLGLLEKGWCLRLGSGKSTKQFNVGFFNPIAPCLPEHACPVICIIYKHKGRIFTKYYRDNEPVEIKADE